MRVPFAGLAFPILLSGSGLIAREIPRPLPGNPGNVYTLGQEITVPAAAEERWICIDYDGREIASGQGDEVKLGKLPVGYYEVWKPGPDGSRGARSTLAVLAPLQVPTPDDSPIALDTAAAWFFRDPANRFGLREAANLSALAGVSWTRDRLSWKETEPERGKFAKGSIYDRSAEAFSSQGIKVLQVFHDCPSWAGGQPKFFPDDLRDVHDYLKTMAARWKGMVHAWEPWNEGDTTNFGGHTGDEMVAYQKAAFLGIRAGNPEAIVCQNVFAEHQKTAVLENYIENLDAGSFDTFNFHHYIQPGSIPRSYADMRQADGGRPIWVTESFFHFRQNVKQGDLELPAEARKARARFVTTNLATALNEGPERFFTFVLPHYVEGGVLFGLLNADGTPRPDYVALAAAGRLLAGAKPLGRLKGTPSAYAFSAMPDGQPKTVVVAWADQAAPLPADLSRGTAYDFLGREQSSPALGKDPVYILLPPGSPLDLSPSLAEKPGGPHPDTGPLVIQISFPKDRRRLASSSWQVKATESLEVPARVYHFGGNPATVSMSAEADPALRITLATPSFAISPGERHDVTMKVEWSGATVPARPMTVKLTARAGGLPDSTSVIRVSTPMGDITPLERAAVGSAADPSKWKPGSSGGDLQLVVSDGALDAAADLKPGDRWVYPWNSLAAEDRPAAGMDGIAFTLTPRDSGANYHVMLREPGGTTYVAAVGNLPGDGTPRRLVMLFSEFHRAPYSPEDANHALDLDRIEALAIGGNPSGAKFGYKVGDVAWVKFAK